MDEPIIQAYFTQAAETPIGIFLIFFGSAWFLFGFAGRGPDGQSRMNEFHMKRRTPQFPYGRKGPFKYASHWLTYKSRGNIEVDLSEEPSDDWMSGACGIAQMLIGVIFIVIGIVVTIVTLIR
ncbi:MAG: hypothetical protein HQ478_07755 [Chloroflexi bacterium]|nr:hypothetical protein [Chloroflexota bacterium]